MPYAGHSLKPREVAQLCALHWTNPIKLIKADATFLGESSGSIGAWHDNEDADGLIVSRDCGLAQINIPARLIGMAEEFILRTDSLDRNVYWAVAENNIRRARQLYDTPWTRNGKLATRLFQPWYAYTKGWATFPEWWVWARPDLDHWAPTGRYVQKAIVGVANWHVMIEQDMSPNEALTFAQTMQDFFKVEGTLGVRVPKDPVPWIGSIAWLSFPSKPSTPPSDGIGPRPVPNDGQ